MRCYARDLQNHACIFYYTWFATSRLRTLLANFGFVMYHNHKIHVIIGFKHDGSCIVRSETLRDHSDKSVHSALCASCTDWSSWPLLGRVLGIFRWNFPYASDFLHWNWNHQSIISKYSMCDRICGRWLYWAPVTPKWRPNGDCTACKKNSRMLRCAQWDLLERWGIAGGIALRLDQISFIPLRPHIDHTHRAVSGEGITYYPRQNGRSREANSASFWGFLQNIAVIMSHYQAHL